MGERLLDRVCRLILAMRYRHRTNTLHVQWARRFIVFHDRRHPREMGKAEVEAFLAYLAVDRHVAAATRNQALNSLLFLDREALEMQLPWIDLDAMAGSDPGRETECDSAA